jgi:hypothetical protein
MLLVIILVQEEAVLRRVVTAKRQGKTACLKSTSKNKIRLITTLHQ